MSARKRELSSSQEVVVVKEWGPGRWIGVWSQTVLIYLRTADSQNQEIGQASTVMSVTCQCPSGEVYCVPEESTQ